ncbi:peptidase inhibitor family I36 protein [Bacillus bingmayongensis]|uniref:peptidase inhibitor family I36 protein n=1 Tax=Bacillus bingmayongensis TaxID=1150157 RepID=UPI0002FF4861|nr:peptidase inhibitor family I36 protein [Bacillus bingmayongensis]MBY0596304.1 peptidase inhibitor family I36 protein [Bacillus bingmayongensis]
MKKIVVTLLAFVLAIIPITAFADTTSTSVSKQTLSTENMVQLKDLPVMIDGVKYAQDDSHVKNVTQFVFDDVAKAEGVVYGFTNQDRLNAHLQSAVVERKKDTKNNMITAQAVYYNSYFYEHSNYGGNSFGASGNISWVGSYWNDKISSLKAGYNHNWTVMCWDINYGGARFWVQSGINVNYVGSTWNDKASSIFFTN